MDSPLKQRLIGAAVLAALAIIFLPMLLKGPDVREPDAAAVPLSMPPAPGQEYETRELPLTEPAQPGGPGGVLGLDRGPDGPDAQAADAELPVLDRGPSAAGDATAGESDTAGAVPVETPVVTAPVPAAAVAAGNYVVTIGTFGNLANATALADKLRAAKLPVAADRVALAAGPAMRLRVGPYGDRAAAEAARLRADSVTGGAAKVIVLDAEEPGPTAAVAVPAKPAARPAPPPAAPPASAVSPATVPETSQAPLAAGFAVQLSAPSVEAEALALRDRARSQGFNSFVQRVETASGVRYRVRVGPVADRSAALTLRDSVNGKLGTKGIVVPNP